jgi:RNA polymerase sigma-70 factor (ECF subfamily)
MTSLNEQKPRLKLVECYYERRSALLRFFTARTRSREMAEDIVQDIAARIMELPAPSQSDINNPAAFLYRIGCHLMLDRIKSRNRSTARDADWVEAHVTHCGPEAIAELPRADDALEARERLQQVLDIIGGLGPQCQRAFRLHKLEGLSHAEVAATLGISRSAVEKHISHALRTLLARLP